MINLYGIHNMMKERFTAYAALLIYPQAGSSMRYEAVPIHITALTIDGAGEFLIDAVSTMGTYHPAIPIQRVCMSKHGAALCDARDKLCGYCESDECEKCIVTALIDDAYNETPEEELE